jgi:DNA (cytosine-5)-methyltransferase 1
MSSPNPLSGSPSHPVSAYRLTPPSGASADGAPTAVDLFAGVGGLGLGLLNAGFDLRLSVDHAASCEATHLRNLRPVPFLRSDLRTLSTAEILAAASLTPGELDLLAGGPPCQGFSIIGQRQTDDPRNGLLDRFMQIACGLQPRVILIENVTGLATLAGGAVLSELAAAFDRAGYSIDAAELLAAHYGVPQLRWRMFFIGWRKDLANKGGFPKPTHGCTGIGDLVPNRTISEEQLKGFVRIAEAIGDLPPVAAGATASRYTRAPDTTYQRAMRAGAPTRLHNHYAPRLSAQNIRRIEHLSPGEDWRSLPFELSPAGMQRALRKDHTRRFRRMQWHGVARCIITRFRDPKSGEYIHPEQSRTISIREAARIQSFPDWFVFEGSLSEQYELVGNAVPPLLGKAVGTEIYAMLRADRPQWRDSVKCRYRIPGGSFALEAVG